MPDIGTFHNNEVFVFKPSTVKYATDRLRRILLVITLYLRLFLILQHAPAAPFARSVTTGVLFSSFTCTNPTGKSQ